jgi:hypothetical protein
MENPMLLRHSVCTLLVLACLALIAVPLAAQSPNTSSMTIVVTDESGAVIKNAKVSVANAATGATREATSGTDGSATIPALPLTGTYTVAVSKEGFGNEELKGITLRSGETATLKVKLLVGSGKAEITVYGTTEGVRTDPQIGRSLDTLQIDETPILGRKISSLPLLNAAFRQAKGTGDLFVNQTYFTTGAGSRRTTTFTLDGASNDEAWGRQTQIATVPLGAVQEVTVLSNSFSSEFGWTAGSAINVVTKSGTNGFHGEGLFMARPGDLQADKFSTRNFCPPSVPSCVTPATLQAIRPVDIPDSLKQVSVSIGGPIFKDKTFFFVSSDYTWQDRTTFLSSGLPSFVLPADGHLDYTGHYRQGLFDGRLDHKFTPDQSLMLRFNIDRFHDDNPQDAVGGTNAPSVARIYSRRSWTTQANLTSTFSPNLVNEARFAYLNGDPVTHWDAPVISTTYTRGGTVPFTIGQSRFSDLFGRQAQFSDTLSWSRGRHYLRFGGSLLHHTSGGIGSEPGTAILGTFTFSTTGPRGTLPFDQLTLADVQSYTQPISFGINSYELTQWLYTGFVQDHIRVRNDFTVDLGLRYDRQDLTTATKNFAPRVGFGWNPGGNSRLAIRGGYGMYYTQIRTNSYASYLVNGLDGLATYSATPGQPGFPTCLTDPCLPVAFAPNPATLPARDITIRAGQSAFYTAQFAKYGLDFSKVPNYPDEFVNPRSQVVSIGAELEISKGLFVGGDYVHQHWTGLDRTVDLNAPTPFDRTAPNQCRAGACSGTGAVTNTANVNAANLTRPILPVVGGVRQINVLTNLGIGDYDGLQTNLTYRGNSRFYAAFSYTLSKATNTTEPDGNGINPDQGNIARLGEIERGPSVLDQRHRAVLMASYRLPLNFTIGTLSQFASARPFNATTGFDNNGDGSTNDRPVVNGKVMSKSGFRGTMTSDVGIFVENRLKLTERMSVLLRAECFNLLNHGNYLGRGLTIYGEGPTPSASFGQLVATNSVDPANALPAFANVDPPRMVQLQVRFVF